MRRERTSPWQRSFLNVSQPGSIVKVLKKILEASTPDRFTTDFLETKLGCRGGNYRQFISIAKKLALINSDGTPTDLYKKYRNSETSEAAMAHALKAGYRELFERNEYANSLTREKLKGLVVEITGLAPTNRVVQLVCQTFEALKQLANFEASLPSRQEEPEHPKKKARGSQSIGEGEDHEIDLNLSYTINLVLPKTDDPAIFNAIFRSLRDNLLRK